MARLATLQAARISNSGHCSRSHATESHSRARERRFTIQGRAVRNGNERRRAKCAALVRRLLRAALAFLFIEMRMMIARWAVYSLKMVDFDWESSISLFVFFYFVVYALHMDG